MNFMQKVRVPLERCKVGYVVDMMPAQAEGDPHHYLVAMAEPGQPLGVYLKGAGAMLWVADFNLEVVDA